MLLKTPEAREKAIERFPVLGERRKQVAGSLSGGEQQMLSLAPSLAQPPKVFIADEPTLGLAPLAAETVVEALRELRELGLGDPARRREGPRGHGAGGRDRVPGARQRRVVRNARRGRRRAPRRGVPGWSSRLRSITMVRSLRSGVTRLRGRSLTILVIVAVVGLGSLPRRVQVPVSRTASAASRTSSSSRVPRSARGHGSTRSTATAASTAARSSSSVSTTTGAIPRPRSPRLDASCAGSASTRSSPSRPRASPMTARLPTPASPRSDGGSRAGSAATAGRSRSPAVARRCCPGAYLASGGLSSPRCCAPAACPVRPRRS